VKILLEGRPGSGKTTVARRAVALLKDARVPLSGFTTEEIRSHGRRLGFGVETVRGQRAILAHTDFRGPFRVGKYGVDLEAFERLVVPELEVIPPDAVAVIDELGRMELASNAFRAVVASLFDGNSAVLATVHSRRDPFTDGLKRRSDIQIWRVDPRDRDRLPAALVSRLGIWTEPAT
jgi:nucleoside-triphosphatase